MLTCCDIFIQSLKVPDSNDRDAPRLFIGVSRIQRIRKSREESEINASERGPHNRTVEKSLIIFRVECKSVALQGRQFYSCRLSYFPTVRDIFPSRMCESTALTRRPGGSNALMQDTLSRPVICLPSLWRQSCRIFIALRSPFPLLNLLETANGCILRGFCSFDIVSNPGTERRKSLYLERDAML